VSNKDKTRLRDAGIRMRELIVITQDELRGLYGKYEGGDESRRLALEIEQLEGRIVGQRTCLAILAGRGT
jgi:hypothetical protein